MYYGIDNYLHLTGVGTRLSSSQFYNLAKNGHLQSNQMYFNERYPLPTAMKKSDNLKKLGEFITEGYFVIKDFVTDTCTYPQDSVSDIFAIISTGGDFCCGINRDTDRFFFLFLLSEIFYILCKAGNEGIMLFFSTLK